MTTPYRDDAVEQHDRVATRWFVQSRATSVLFLFASVAFMVATAALVLLHTPVSAIAGVAALLFAALAEQAVRRIDISRDRILLRAGYLRRKIVRSVSIADGAEVRVIRAGGFRNVGTANAPRTQPYVAHLVEIHTANGSWVVFESDDPARANAMAEFVEASLPPRLRIATSVDPEIALAAAEEEANAPESASATRRG